MPRVLALIVAAGAIAALILFVRGVPFGRHGGIAVPAQAVATLDRSMRAIADSEAESPRDRWDPDYVVQHLGRDPDRVYAWVRDHTDWIPYRGVLRGPVGVLMDRRGNSMDRALLLATLLEKSGQTVRLAHGELTRDQATALLPDLSSRQAPLRRSAAAGEPDDARAAGAIATELRAAAAQYGLDASGVDSIVTAWMKDLDSTSGALRRRASEEAQRLLAAVGHAQPGLNWGQNFDAGVAALQDHWWVQWQRADGSWTDLDLLRSAGRATPSVAASETLGLEALADAPVHQEIVLRVISEQWSAQGVKEHAALEQVLRPEALIGQTISLQFWPTRWFSDAAAGVDTGAAAAKQDWRAEVLDQHAWAAGLMIGSEVVSAAALPESGGIDSAPVKDERGGPMGGLASAFSETMNGPAKAAGAARDGGTQPGDTTLSAVWLEYEIRIPGARPRTIRRTVFDLIGPAARNASKRPSLTLDQDRRLVRGLALTMHTEFLPQNCELAPEFVMHLLAQTALGSRPLLARVIGGHSRAGRVDDSGSVSPVQPLSSLYALALARLQWSADRGKVYIDQPNLITDHHFLYPRGKGLVLRHATDIVANEIGVDLRAEDPFAVRLAQGVLDTNAEGLARAGEATFGNVGEAYAARRDWVKLTAGPDQAALPDLALPDDTRRMIGDDLTAGYLAVAPPAAIPMPKESFAGWWRVDPIRGDTLGFGSNGWGQDLGEAQVQNTQAVSMGQRFLNMAIRFSVIFDTTYGWCLAPMMVNAAGTQGLHLGVITAVLAESSDECTGDAIFIGLMGTATLPLVAISLEATETAARSAAPKSPAPPKAPVSPNAKTYNGAPSEPCAPPPAADLVPAPTPEMPPDALPGESEVPGGPGAGRKASQWPSNESERMGADGTGPFKPAYVDTMVKEALAEQPLAQQAYSQAVNAADGAELAYEQADAAVDRANAALNQAITNEKAGIAHYSYDELATLKAQKTEASKAQYDTLTKKASAGVAKREALRDLQGANRAAEHWEQMKLANYRRIQAANALDDALHDMYADACQSGQGLPPNGSAKQLKAAAASKEYQDALQNWWNTEYGAPSASGPADPMGATQPDPMSATQPDPMGPPQNPQPTPGAPAAPSNPGSLDQTQPAQSGKTQRLPAAPAGAAPDPLAPSPAAKTAAGILSAGKVLGGN